MRPNLISTEQMAAPNLQPMNVIGVGDRTFVLEYSCPTCRGDHSLECPKCKGIGRVPSREGAQILALVTTHLSEQLKTLEQNARRLLEERLRHFMDDATGLFKARLYELEEKIRALEQKHAGKS